MDEIERCKYLKDRLLYENKTGKLYWKPKDGNGRYEKAFNKRLAGKEITYKTASGYVCIRFCKDGKTHFQVAHRLIWFLEKGSIPDKYIDHIDGNKENNTISNLRDVSQETNMRNSSKRTDNISGTTGVYYSKTKGKWVAQAKGGKSRHIGIFDTKEDAENAVRSKRLELGYTENHGRENCK